MFTVTMSTDNAAFTEGDAPGEVARILRRIANRLENGDTEGKCVDVNGNAVGDFSLRLER